MRLAEIFTDNMVLQRNKEIALFGYGKGKGTIEFCDKKIEFESVEERFCVYLPAENAGGPHVMKVILNEEETILNNILIGDVYIAAGQSNMEITLRDTTDIPQKENTNVRFFIEPHNADPEMNNIRCNESVWQVCDRETILDFSAIGYDVANMINEQTDIPIGIIGCNKGASRVDAWTDPNIVETPSYQKMISEKHWDYDIYKFNQNSWLYINKLLPIVPFTVNGIIWYQGESNRRHEEALYYDKMLELMIGNWRELWRENLPFYCVQLMPFEEEYADWATIRKGQELVSKNVNNVYLVTLCNTGEENLIHPTKKHTVSIMLANTILNTLYGWDKPCCGPVYREVKKANGYIEITFYHNEGLTFDGENAEDIFVYDENNIQHPADCVIKDNRLVIFELDHIDIKRITMGYANVPKHNLYNGAGFWASPFEILL